MYASNLASRRCTVMWGAAVLFALFTTVHTAESYNNISLSHDEAITQISHKLRVHLGRAQEDLVTESDQNSAIEQLIEMAKLAQSEFELSLNIIEQNQAPIDKRVYFNAHNDIHAETQVSEEFDMTILGLESVRGDFIRISEITSEYLGKLNSETDFIKQLDLLASGLAASEINRQSVTRLQNYMKTRFTSLEKLNDQFLQRQLKRYAGLLDQADQGLKQACDASLKFFESAEQVILEYSTGSFLRKELKQNIQLSRQKMADVYEHFYTNNVWVKGPFDILIKQRALLTFSHKVIFAFKELASAFDLLSQTVYQLDIMIELVQSTIEGLHNSKVIDWAFLSDTLPISDQTVLFLSGLKDFFETILQILKSPEASKSATERTFKFLDTVPRLLKVQKKRISEAQAAAKMHCIRTVKTAWKKLEHRLRLQKKGGINISWHATIDEIVTASVELLKLTQLRVPVESNRWRAKDQFTKITNEIPRQLAKLPDIMNAAGLISEEEFEGWRERLHKPYDLQR